MRHSSAPTVRPPRQARSQETAARIGRALVALLAHRTLDEIAVPELCARARASVSSFYARFSDKRALLDWLDQQYFEDSRRTMSRLLEPDRWQGASLSQIVRGLMQGYVEFLRKHADLLRCMVLTNRARPASQLSRRSRELNLQSYERVSALLLTRRSEIRHPAPEFAVQLGLAAVYSLSHELVLFARSRLHPLELDDRGIALALGDTFLALLGSSRPKAR